MLTTKYEVLELDGSMDIDDSGYDSKDETCENTPPPTIHIDNDGDLTLVIGPEKREFVVCSRDLTRASRVFKAMLDGGFRESRPTLGFSHPSSWVVTLPEDCETAAELLLSIVHAVYDHIPTSLSLEELHDALVFSEKYDMTKFFRPWIRGWTPSWSTFDESADYSTVIGVAYELGIEDVLELVAKRMCVECGVNPEGQLVGPDSKPVEQPDMALCPPGLYENATAIRLALLNDIFHRLRTLITTLQDLIATSKTGYCPLIDSKPYACHSMTLGLIISGLGKWELQMVWDSHDELGLTYPFSVNHLVGVVRGIRTITRSDKHKACNPVSTVLQEIEAVLAARENPVTEEHLGYLRRQQEKLGVLVAKDGSDSPSQTPPGSPRE